MISSIPSLKVGDIVIIKDGSNIGRGGPPGKEATVKITNIIIDTSISSITRFHAKLLDNDSSWPYIYHSDEIIAIVDPNKPKRKTKGKLIGGKTVFQT